MFVIEVCMYVASDNYESHEGSIRKSIIQRININKYIFLILHTLELCCYAIFTQRRVPHMHYAIVLPQGAVAGMLTSLTLMLWISVGYQIHKPKVATFSPISVEGCNWNISDKAPPSHLTSLYINSLNQSSTLINSTITAAAEMDS